MKKRLMQWSMFLCLAGAAVGQELPTEMIVCEYPRLKIREPFPSLDPTRLAAAAEAEPNDTLAASQKIPLGFGPMQQQDVDVSGQIGSFDRDWFKFEATGGDTLGVAVLAVDAASVDSLVTVVNAGGVELLQNDQHGWLASYYPPESPFPAGGTIGDAAMTFAFPSSGTYYVRIHGRGASSGGYVAQFRLRQPPFRSAPVGTKQILFLDFDGANGIHADEMFGSGGVHNATLTGLDGFLAGWSISPVRKNALIDAIVAEVSAHFAELLVGTNSQIEIRNSKDHPDPFGQPNVSRVVVGGKISELGIGTIGIAQYIDPANYSTDDTAVVLLDLLSAPATNPNSVLSLPRAPGMTVDAAVARVVACVVSHEAGHFLGCWHTENSNAIGSIMDRGGNLPNLAGVGPDGILGTADDRSPLFHDDHYANEGIGRSHDVENVRAQVIASLALGTVPPAQAAAALNAVVVGLQAARAVAPVDGLAPRYTPLDTRKILKLPVDAPQTFRPQVESPTERLDGAIKKLNKRLESLRSQ